MHPGYGFLSESPKLPIALSQHQPGGKSIVFIGPSPNSLRIASDKMLSRDLATSLNIPVAPGRYISSSDEILTFSRSLRQGTANGYPLIIKALDGGGGRGIRIVHHEDEVDEAFQRLVISWTFLACRVFFVKKVCFPNASLVDVSEKVRLGKHLSKRRSQVLVGSM